MHRAGDSISSRVPLRLGRVRGSLSTREPHSFGKCPEETPQGVSGRTQGLAESSNPEPSGPMGRSDGNWRPHCNLYGEWETTESEEWICNLLSPKVHMVSFRTDPMECSTLTFPVFLPRAPHPPPHLTTPGHISRGRGPPLCPHDDPLRLSSRAPSPVHELPLSPSRDFGPRGLLEAESPPLVPP